MRSRLIALGMLVFFTLNSTGCWDNIELDDRSIVTGIGIDKDEKTGEIIVSAQVFVPRGSSSSNKSSGSSQQSDTGFVVDTAKARTLDDAIRMLNLSQKGYIYFNQNRLLVINENIAKKGIAPILDFFNRYIQNNPRIEVVISKDKASDVLSIEGGKFTIPADYIVSSITTDNLFSNLFVDNLHDFSVKISGKTTSPVTALIKIKDSYYGGTGILADEAAVFKEDKLVGSLNMSEIRGLCWIMDRYPMGSVQEEDSEENDVNGSEIVLRAKTKIDSKIINGKPEIIIDVKQEGNLYMEEGVHGVTSQKEVMELEQKFSKSVKKDIEACLIKAQQDYQTDIFGFGDEIHRKFPKQWNEMKDRWDTEFPNIAVSVKVNSKIRGIGSIYTLQ